MLGKAVKFRHCPATVSAPGSPNVERGDQLESSCRNWAKGPQKPLEPGSGKVTGRGASQETGPARSTSLRSEADGGAIMPFRSLHHLYWGRSLSVRIAAVLLFCGFAVAGHAASIRGVVTDASGARVSGATVDLVSQGQVVGAAVSGADGSFQ